jgi:hypothetical protein
MGYEFICYIVFDLTLSIPTTVRFRVSCYEVDLLCLSTGHQINVSIADGRTV